MEVKCVAPRKMVNVMKAFLVQVNEMTYVASTMKPLPAGEDLCKWLGNEDNWEEMEFPCAIRVTRHTQDSCCAFLAEHFDNDKSVVHIGYAKNLMNNPYHNNYFTSDFRRRCSIGKGFTGITLSLLHEMGHFATEEKCKKDNPDYCRGMAIFEAQCKAKTNKELNEKYYFRLPDETYATEWAIEWLKDAEHRKIAKAFERKFFECFESYEKRA